ncbi:MAG TPA: GNAT family N-acetyltransferase [Anaerolineales bacterium]|nr:GNAT family N-acetyltransferase [Anaerolineales bacterium]
MTAAAISSAAPARGMRAIDPRRDLGGLGSVIEAAFAERLDPEGKRMVQAMRSFGRWGRLGWAIGRWFLPPAAFPQGYVWLEEGRIVGNASLMRVDEAPRRWVLINVAVEPTWRRRGIGSSLVRACLDEARRRGAHEVFLQVDASEAGAQELYARLGFRVVSHRTTWNRIAGWSPPAETAQEPARARRSADSLEHLALVRRLHPEGLLWPRPLDSAGVLDGVWARHWVWPEEGPLMASLSAFPGYEAPGVHWLMVLDPLARGRAEAALLDRALHASPGRGTMRLEVDHAADESSLRAHGFQPGRSLKWMALTLGLRSAVEPTAR